MKLSNGDRRLQPSDIERVEQELGLQLPAELKMLYLDSNGGEPQPYLYEDDYFLLSIGTVLPLVSNRRTTAVATYKRLVLEEQLAPSDFFPFATDAGGSTFLVDCSTPEGVVHIHRSDALEGPAGGLQSLGVGLAGFWDRLREADGDHE